MSFLPHSGHGLVHCKCLLLTQSGHSVVKQVSPNPFTVPYSSSPASSQAGSNPSQTTGGIPALWVTEDVGTLIKSEIAGKAVPVTVHLDSEIKQVSTSTV